MRAAMQRMWQRIRPMPLRPVILMYHRIATPIVDPWALAVSPRHFEQQLSVLRRTRVVLPVAELVDGVQRGTLPANAIAVTFDDGYVDNLTEARPRLLDASVPATLFVATGFLDRPRAYWWDELADILLAGATAIECELTAGRERWTIRVSAGADEESSRGWRAWQEPLTERQRAYTETYSRLRAASAADRARIVACLRGAAGVTASADDNRPMTSDELVQWSAHPSMDVGAHTGTHPLLTAIDRDDCAREIAASKEACERLLNRAVVGFAYPHGAHDEHVRGAVARSGLAWACTTEPRALDRRNEPDVYALPRLAAADYDGVAFERSLRSVCAG